MKPVERTALVDRLARAIAWAESTVDQQAALRRRASAIVDELLAGQQQSDRLGWMFVDSDIDEEAPT